MKILVIAPTPFFADRGTHIRILEEALALEKLGHQITIATYHIGRDITDEVETKIDVRRIRRWLFWYKKLEAGPDWQKIILDMMLIRKVFFLARTQKPDIIHGHLHEGALIGWIVKKLLFWRKIKLVCDFHGSLVREMESHNYLGGGFLKKVFSFLEKIINRTGDFAVVSSWENKQIISNYRRDGKVETILDGVNIHHYEKLLPKKELKKELELPEDKIVAIYAGALVPNKGIEFLFGAITKVLKETNNVYFIIAGFPAEPIKKFVKENKLEGIVRIISPLNYFSMPEILKACDLGIDPKESSTGQASGKILQYMAAGLPVVCFDRKNNHNYLDEGGYFSKEISSGGIAEGILYFNDNHMEIERMGNINLERVKIFSWDASAGRLDAFYKEITK